MGALCKPGKGKLSKLTTATKFDNGRFLYSMLKYLRLMLETKPRINAERNMKG